jgi:hypothetical protein
MRHHRGVGGMVLGMLFQLRQEGFDLALDLATRGVRMPFLSGVGFLQKCTLPSSE